MFRPSQKSRIQVKESSQISSHADLFSSAAYLCIQQESMSVTALSRLLEAVTKSIRHLTAMSTILATELFQARRDAATTTSNWKIPVKNWGMLQSMLNLCLITKSKKLLNLITKRNNRDF